MFVASPGDPTALPAYPALDDGDATAEEIARAYLQVNCAMCHQPDGPTRSDMDLRASTPLAEMNVCATPTFADLGVMGADIVTAGDPEGSVLALRISRLDADQMPPIGTSLVDEAGVGAIQAWIDGLASCP